MSNGKGIGVALFVQGCRLRCKNCFNPETWDFNGGKEWTKDIRDKFIALANKPYIKRISILGGEPLAEENLDNVLDLVNKIRLTFPQKSIWIYSGYMWEYIFSRIYVKDDIVTTYPEKYQMYRQHIIKLCDVLIDGRYIDQQRDISLKWRGSKNQRVIDIQKSLQKGEVVLWTS